MNLKIEIKELFEILKKERNEILLDLISRLMDSTLRCYAVVINTKIQNITGSIYNSIYIIRFFFLQNVA